MTSRRSSGSRRVESAVEPTRSQNITVSWRRSAAAPARAGAAGAAAAAVAAAAGAASPSATPHCAQKREPGALAWPQAAQLRACGAPHWGQKRLSPGISLLQLGQALVFAMQDHIAAEVIPPSRAMAILLAYPAAGFDPAPIAATKSR